MKFGMPTLIEFDNLEQTAQKAKELGLDFIEVNASFPAYQFDKLDVNELKSLKEKYGVFFTIHADEIMNPLDFNSKVSSCYTDIMLEYIEFAKALEIPVINLHLIRGVYVTLPCKVVYLTNVYEKDYLEKVREFISKCESAIGDYDIRICIENVDSNEFTASQIKALEMFMNSKVFNLTLDIGHEAKLNNVDSKIYKQYPDRLYHMHYHDYDGKNVHLALGDGILDLESKINQLKGNTCLIEVKDTNGLEKSLKYLSAHNFFGKR